jgi:hypothetical protein
MIVLIPGIDGLGIDELHSSQALAILIGLPKRLFANNKNFRR